MPQTVRSEPVGTSLRWLSTSRPSGEKYSDRVVDRGSRRFALLHPDDEPHAVLAAIAASRSAAGPGMTTALLDEACANHSSSPSQIGRVSIQIGVPGTKASGNTTSCAPCAGGLGGQLLDPVDRGVAVHQDVRRLHRGDLSRPMAPSLRWRTASRTEGRLSRPARCRPSPCRASRKSDT